MTKVSELTAAARAGFASLGRVFENREIRDSRRHSPRSGTVWSADLAEMLEAGLINLDSMADGFADRHRQPWLNQLDRGKIDLGTGKRMLVKGGTLDPKYHITVPSDLNAPI